MIHVTRDLSLIISRSADTALSKLRLNLQTSSQWRILQGFSLGGDMASAGAQAYNGSLGRKPQRGPGANLGI